MENVYGNDFRKCYSMWYDNDNLRKIVFLGISKVGTRDFEDDRTMKKDV